MKFTKAIVTAAAIITLAIPAMASNSHLMKEKKSPNIMGYFNMLDSSNGNQQLLARGGAGRGGGSRAGSGSGHKYGVGDGSGRSGSSYGPGDGTGRCGGGYGPGDGTGNNGSGPKDGSGNGPQTGDCPQS